MRATVFVTALLLTGAGFLVLVMPLCGCSTMLGAYASVMQSDLKNLVAAQEAYLADHGVYAADLGQLEFGTSTDVTVSMLRANAAGWAARATHTAFQKGAYHGADCVASGGNPEPEPQTTLKRRSPRADRRVVCDLDGWSPSQSRLERWRWRLSD